MGTISDVFFFPERPPRGLFRKISCWSPSQNKRAFLSTRFSFRHNPANSLLCYEEILCSVDMKQTKHNLPKTKLSQQKNTKQSYSITKALIQKTTSRPPHLGQSLGLRGGVAGETWIKQKESRLLQDPKMAKKKVFLQNWSWPLIFFPSKLETSCSPWPPSLRPPRKVSKLSLSISTSKD